MLALTRKLMQSIHINDNIVVTVVAMHGNAVRIGIEAPADIPVHRTEVYEAITESRPRRSRPSSLRQAGSVGHGKKGDSVNLPERPGG